MTKKTKGRIALIGFDADSRREYITGERKRRDINRVMHLERHKNKEYQAKLEKRRQKREQDRLLVETMEKKRLLIQQGKNPDDFDLNDEEEEEDFGFGTSQKQVDSDSEDDEPVVQKTSIKKYEKKEVEDGIDNITVTVEPFSFDGNDDESEEEGEPKVYPAAEPTKQKVEFTKKEMDKKIKELHQSKYNSSKKHVQTSSGITKSAKKYKKKREKIMKKHNVKKAKRAARKGTEKK